MPTVLTVRPLTSESDTGHTGCDLHHTPAILLEHLRHKHLQRVHDADDVHLVRECPLFVSTGQTEREDGEEGTLYVNVHSSVVPERTVERG